MVNVTTATLVMVPVPAMLVLGARPVRCAGTGSTVPAVKPVTARLTGHVTMDSGGQVCVSVRKDGPENDVMFSKLRCSSALHPALQRPSVRKTTAASVDRFMLVTDSPAQVNTPWFSCRKCPVPTFYCPAMMLSLSISTVVDMCKIWNGGCAREAKCSQRGEKVSCRCPQGHSGDGFTCLPMDPCASGDNGGCHEHATCTMVAPVRNKAAPALTVILRYATLGVFHYRSVKGQYKLNYTEAQQDCRAKGGSLATYAQLSYAQQARVAYPTTYSNPNCGFGHVGIVDYGTRKNLSETWDAFCYRMKEVQCECKPGYIGDGFSCAGNLLQVLRSTPTFSNFLIQILNYSEVSKSGQTFVKRLSDPDVQSTLFVPENSGLPENLVRPSDRSHLPTVSELQCPHLCVPTDPVPAGHRQTHVAHQAGMGVVLLILLVAGAILVGYRFYSHNSKPFQFHYFKI
ncbi:hypothetical protein GOODEAATRI_016088 [Goodea atripinnis]|uniref:EGF-like domain-containing protein n=1 Tax=Goodea atripinnis TaxID=208336 RepID=A0ABV0N1X1_9TELE